MKCTIHFNKETNRFVYCENGKIKATSFGISVFFSMNKTRCKGNVDKDLFPAGEVEIPRLLRGKGQIIGDRTPEIDYITLGEASSVFITEKDPGMVFARIGDIGVYIPELGIRSFTGSHYDTWDRLETEARRNCLDISRKGIVTVNTAKVQKMQGEFQRFIQEWEEHLFKLGVKKVID